MGFGYRLYPSYAGLIKGGHLAGEKVYDVLVSHTGSTTRGLALAGQLLAVLLAVSLALRPPGFARRLASEDPRREPDEPRPGAPEAAELREPEVTT
jgi:hypothetical protein